MTKPVRVPLAAVAVGLVLVGVSVLLAVLGGQATGVAWDEPYRVGKLNNYLTSGWFVDDVVDGRPLDFNAYVYAPIADLLAHSAGVLAGAQQWAHAAATSDAYATRHLTVGLLALAGLAAAASLGGLLLGSWRWAAVTGGLLASTPLWTGHAMFNSSDIPVAAGYTISTLAGTLLVRACVRRVGPWAWVAAGALLAVGILLAVGTRPATWPALAVSGVVIAAGVVAAAGPGRRWRALAVGVGVVLASVAAAYAVLVAVYPAAFADPVRVLVDSVGQSASFGAEPTPRIPLPEAIGYVPSWLAIQLPIAVGFLLACGLVAAGVGVWRGLGPGTWPSDAPESPDASEGRWRAVGIVLVGCQLLVLPAGAALLGSTVYDGLRQFLFILPAIAVMSTLGLAALLALAARAPRGSAVLPGIVWGLVGIGVLLPVVDQIHLFPYGYAYVNEAASREPVNGRLPTDYWRTSMRELIPMVPATGATDCTFDPLVLGLVPIDCATAGQLSPFWDHRGESAIDVAVPTGKYLFLEANRGRAEPGAGCTVLDRVVRSLHGQDLVMSYVALCEAPCVIEPQAQCGGKDIGGAVLDGLNLAGSDFTSARLVGTSLILTDLSDANLAGADLTDAILASADLSRADLTGANLTGADLTGANLTGAKLTDTNLTGVVGYEPALRQS